MNKKLFTILLALLLLPIMACTADAPGYMYVVDGNYNLEVAKGNVTGAYVENKFGRNIEVDSAVTADVWDGGHTLASGGVSLIWVAPTQARIHDIASSSADDDGDPVGVGARTVRIYGLKTWYLAETSEDIIMNGAVNAPTVNSYVIIHRIEVLTKGATSINVGIITATARTDNTITAQIRAGQGQTQMAIYGIPSGQVAFMSQFYLNANKAGGATALIDSSLLMNPEPDAELLNFQVKHTTGLMTAGTSAYSHTYDPPKTFTGPAIIKVQILSGTNSVDVSAGFDLILVDN